jgi:hypothetical protein
MSTALEGIRVIDFGEAMMLADSGRSWTLRDYSFFPNQAYRSHDAGVEETDGG